MNWHVYIRGAGVAWRASPSAPYGAELSQPHGLGSSLIEYVSIMIHISC
jgi:hypothetical protein